ncbi:small ribosomal subunit protein bS18m [Chironomus tepperi]|uniref:small ribosomal subunit protein bS18m n=1 Tax=Chironomus tepperi TaxID=113505 RepID=UPI00391EEC78
MFLSVISRSIRRVASQNPANLARPFSTTSDPKESNNDEPIDMENPFEKEKIKCILCQHNIEPSYKNVQLLSQFQSAYTGRIYGRHITGLCKSKQEKVEKEIAKAQSVGFMGFVTKDVKYIKDPKLFDPERPIRSHKY